MDSGSFEMTKYSVLWLSDIRRERGKCPCPNQLSYPNLELILLQINISQ